MRQKGERGAGEIEMETPLLSERDKEGWVNEREERASVPPDPLSYTT